MYTNSTPVLTFILIDTVDSIIKQTLFLKRCSRLTGLTWQIKDGKLLFSLIMDTIYLICLFIVCIILGFLLSKSFITHLCYVLSSPNCKKAILLVLGNTNARSRKALWNHLQEFAQPVFFTVWNSVDLRRCSSGEFWLCSI